MPFRVRPQDGWDVPIPRQRPQPSHGLLGLDLQPYHPYPAGKLADDRNARLVGRLAEVVAKTTKRNFVRLSGVLSGVADIRKICERARDELGGRGTILFIDEIHRFNKSQQDVLLPYVEDGTVVLIGATTHNPNFFINTPLTSRSLVFELHALEPAAIARLLERALADKEKGYGATPSRLDDDARDFLAEICDGDARHALTAL